MVNAPVKFPAEISPSRGNTVWLTGLPGAGKSTLANLLLEALRKEGLTCCLLDGDQIRKGLSADLGFSAADRHENVRRVAEVARIVNGMCAIAIVAMVSPARVDRERARAIVGDAHFIEVFIDAPVEVCARRDPKGMYLRAAAGQLPNFTGVSAPYERPERAELVIHTNELTPVAALQQIMATLRAHDPTRVGESRVLSH